MEEGHREPDVIKVQLEYTMHGKAVLGIDGFSVVSR